MEELLNFDGVGNYYIVGNEYNNVIDIYIYLGRCFVKKNYIIVYNIISFSIGRLYYEIVFGSC